MQSRIVDVDPLTEAQWNGVFACKFVPDAQTRRDHGISDGRKFHCKLARMSYLPLISAAVFEHYFEREHANLRISYELLVGQSVPQSGGGGAKGGTSAVASGGADGAAGAEASSAAPPNEQSKGSVPVPEYYPLGVIVDYILGKEFSVLTFQFRIFDGAPLNSEVLGFRIADSERNLLLQLHQQQKAACAGLFGGIGCFMKLSPDLVRQLDDAARQNDVTKLLTSRSVIFKIGAADMISKGILGVDLALFVFHKDGQHVRRIVSVRHCPTLGLVLKTCVACFHDLDEIDNQVADAQKHACVLLTGVEPSLSTPTEFLMESLSALDFAVHLCVIQPADSVKPRGILPQRDWSKPDDHAKQKQTASPV